MKFVSWFVSTVDTSVATSTTEISFDIDNFNVSDGFSYYKRYVVGQTLFFLPNYIL